MKETNYCQIENKSVILKGVIKFITGNKYISSIQKDKDTILYKSIDNAYDNSYKMYALDFDSTIQSFIPIEFENNADLFEDIIYASINQDGKYLIPYIEFDSEIINAFPDRFKGGLNKYPLLKNYIYTGKNYQTFDFYSFVNVFCTEETNNRYINTEIYVNINIERGEVYITPCSYYTFNEYCEPELKPIDIPIDSVIGECYETNNNVPASNEEILNSISNEEAETLIFGSDSVNIIKEFFSINYIDADTIENTLSSYAKNALNKIINTLNEKGFLIVKK